METRESVPLDCLGREVVSEGVYVNSDNSNSNSNSEKTYKVRRGRIMPKQFLLGGKSSNKDSSSNKSSSNIQSKPR